MEFLKWYLMIGMIVNVICIIYNVKMNGYRGIDTIKSFNIFAKVIIYCCVFVLEVICWLPFVTLGILRIIANARRSIK